eukprot:89383-Pyramimonas_sp.AAC.1
MYNATPFQRTYEARWGRLLGKVPRRLQTLEGSFFDEGGSAIHGQTSVGDPPAFRPWDPYPRLPHPTPSPCETCTSLLYASFSLPG